MNIRQGALIDGDVVGAGVDHLGIVVMYGGGAHQKFHVRRHVFRPMSDRDRDPVLPQGADIGALVDVRAGHDDAAPLQHLRQRGHGHAADADQMALAAGREIINKIDHMKNSERTL